LDAATGAHNRLRRFFSKRLDGPITSPVHLPIGQPEGRIGNDIYVMLALYSGFGQMVVANEILDGADMIGEGLGKRQRTTHQT